MPGPVYLSINEFPGDGVTTQYEFNFAGGYLERTHVKATIYDALQVATPLTVTDGMFVNDTTLDLGVAAPVGGYTRIYRDTPRDAPLVDFAGGARVSEANLDRITRQAILAVAEAFDAGAYAAVNDLLSQAAASALAAATSAASVAGTEDAVTALAAAADSSATSAAASAAAAAATLAGAVVRAGDTMTGNLTVPSLNGGQLAGFRNKITNGSFIVNQRNVSGTVSGVGGVVCHDRFKGDASIGGNYTFATVNGVVVLTLNSGLWHHTVKGEDIHGNGVDATVPYTLSWVGTATAQINGGGYSASPITVNLTPGADVNVGFSSNGVNGTLALVQLEPGTVATPFEHRPYSVELALCQRDYYRQTIATGGVPYRGVAITTTTTAFRLLLDAPVPMRSAPTIFETSATPGDFTIAHGGASTTLSAAPTLSNCTTDVLQLVGTVASGLTAGQSGYLRNTSANQTYIAWGTGL